MATVAADRLAQQHQRDIATIAGGVTSVVASVALGADPAAVGTWFFGVVDGLITRIQVGYAQSRNSAMQFLPRHAALAGAGPIGPAPGSIDVSRLAKRLEIVGPVGFKASIAAGRDTDEAVRAMASRMAGVADEVVRDGDRDVIEQTALRGEGIVGWRRRLSGRACGFCAMLASRGAVYVNKKRATVSKRGTRYHPHCHCWAEPLYRREEEPAEVRLLQRQWERVTAGHGGADAMRIWRRHWEQRVTPAARRRFGLLAARMPSGGRAAALQPARVRQVLAQAQSPEAVSRALAAEYQRITGRTMTVELRGSVATAREHAEGVLRAVERDPAIRISAVRTGRMQTRRAYAETDPAARTIIFSEDWSSVAKRQQYLEALAADERSGWIAKGSGSPVGVAIHESGHVLDPHLGSLDRQIDQILFSAQRQTGVPLERAIRAGVSGYATRNHRELIAEAWSDVVTNGAQASGLSRAIVRAVEAEPTRGTGGLIIAGERFARASDLSRLPVARLRAMVAEHDITVPPLIRKPALVKLADDLDRGVDPRIARAAAARTVTDERREIGEALIRASELVHNQASERALRHIAGVLRRQSTPEVARTLRPLLEALDAADHAKARAALDVVARKAKLRRLGGDPGDVVPFRRGEMEWIGQSRGEAAFVVRPGYATTYEGKQTLIARAAVAPATPEQVAAMAARRPVKKAAKKAAAALRSRAETDRIVRDLLQDYDAQTLRRIAGELRVSLRTQFQPTAATSRAEIIDRIARDVAAGPRGALEVDLEDLIRSAAESTRRAGRGDVAGAVARLRQARMTEGEVLRLLEADAGLNLPRLRQVAEQLGVELPQSVRSKAAAQSAIARQVSRQGPAKAAKKAAAPAKKAAKAAAPKAPPAPSRMSAAALKTELERAGVTVPPRLPKATLVDEVSALRGGARPAEISARLSPPVATGRVGSQMERLPKLADPADARAVAVGTNPNYGGSYRGPLTAEIERAGGVSYAMNCSRVVIAYEMRRRGLDVTAGAGTPLGDTIAAYIRAFRQDGRYAVRVAQDLSRRMTLSEVVDDVRSWPPGARGIVELRGHTVNVERDASGRVLFIDAQSTRRKQVMTLTEFRQRLRSVGIPEGPMSVARVDDLDMSDYALRYVESPELDIADGQPGKTAMPQDPDSETFTPFEEMDKLPPDDSYP